jgi:hypothetical protein
VLWLGGGGDDDSLSSSLGATANRMRELAVPLLLPSSVTSSNMGSTASAVASVQGVVDVVNRHYDYDAGQQFVGGMGESDPGVWFAALSRTSELDAMLYSDLIVESIERVKEERHGVPFALCTTGLFFPSSSFSDLADCVECLHVTLHASNPKEYQELAGIASLDDAKRALGTVCSFITEAAEQGVPVEAWVRSQAAGPSRDLSLSLGARHVHVL